MGQRSQIYIRYNLGENIVAYHLQWNYGQFMINRAYQLLQFIKGNTEHSFSNFLHENFDTANYAYNGQRDDFEILRSLIEINLASCTMCKGHDLVNEHYEYWNSDDVDSEHFKLDPMREDNNNGILVIDVQEENGQAIIKYGFSIGYEDCADEDYENFEFKMCSARDYAQAGVAYNYYKGQCKTAEDWKEYFEFVAELDKQITYIDDNFQKLTQDEYKAIFVKQYEYAKNLKGYNDKQPKF